MLRKFAAAMLATTLIAGAAFAAQPSGSAGSPPPAATAGSNGKTVAVPTDPTKSVKLAKHMRKHAQKHVRKHIARGKVRAMKAAQHFKGSKTHKARLARLATGAKPGKTAPVHAAKLPATRTN